MNKQMEDYIKRAIASLSGTDSLSPEGDKVADIIISKLGSTPIEHTLLKALELAVIDVG